MEIRDSNFRSKFECIRDRKTSFVKNSYRIRSGWTVSADTRKRNPTSGEVESNGNRRMLKVSVLILRARHRTKNVQLRDYFRKVSESELQCGRC